MRDEVSRQVRRQQHDRHTRVQQQRPDLGPRPRRAESSKRPAEAPAHRPLPRRLRGSRCWAGGGHVRSPPGPGSRCGCRRGRR
jgi:hypothetical protein